MGRDKVPSAPKAKGKGAPAAAPPKRGCAWNVRCSCGNRPERPSHGHKWDEEKQEWVGRGPKQREDTSVQRAPRFSSPARDV